MNGRRNLTTNEQAVLQFILGNASFEGAHELSAQINGTKVVGGPATLLHLKAPNDSPKAAMTDGPAPIRAFVAEPEGDIEGEILIWVKDGRLSGLEFAWYTDTQPSELPEPGLIRLG